MNRAHQLSLTTLALCATVPFVWLACGGSKPPPETPADESASSSSSGEDAAAPSSSSAAADTSSPPPADTPAATPPAAPPFGGSDCAACIDKTCKAQAAACSKNSDCQSMLDAFHGCGSDKGASSCLDSATPPAAGKPKKLGTAYETCAKKAIAKACKAKCQ